MFFVSHVFSGSSEKRSWTGQRDSTGFTAFEEMGDGALVEMQVVERRG
jgi:hypothetical protein